MASTAADDWKVNRKLTLNVGLRWEWFGWPEEKNGYIGNFDPSLVTDPDNPLSGFIVPSNAGLTGFAAVDTSIPATTKASTKSTMNSQDLNNFAPRFGFAYTPFDNNRLVLRGGYGIFYDRPSAAFINTVFSNYPHLREEEVTFPGSNVPLTQRLVATGSEFSVQSVSAESHSPHRRGSRHLSDSRQHECDSRR